MILFCHASINTNDNNAIHSYVNHNKQKNPRWNDFIFKFTFAAISFNQFACWRYCVIFFFLGSLESQNENKLCIFTARVKECNFQDVFFLLNNFTDSHEFIFKLVADCERGHYPLMDSGNKNNFEVICITKKDLENWKCGYKFMSLF